MISLDRAQAIVATTLGSRTLGVEKLPLPAALGRVLATDVVSTLDMPPFDRVTMDGFALAGEERQTRLAVVGEVRAGQTWTEPVQPGAAIKVMTGAPAPLGTGKVVPIEQTREFGGYVDIEPHALASDRRHVAPRGQDLRAGDVVARAGARLDPVRLADLVACGVAGVEVYRQPRLAVMATGDELITDPAMRRGGQILNSNSPLLHGVLRSHGYPVEILSVVPDEPRMTRDRINAALAVADVAVVTGGVSTGDYDYVPLALDELGLQILITRVAIKPGKPLTFAVGERGIVFGLPGNPVSVFVTCHLFVLPALALLEGTRRPLKVIFLPLATPYRERATLREQFLPARLSGTGEVALLTYHGSGHLHTLASADGFVRVPPETETMAAGTRVPFWPVKLAAFLSSTDEDAEEAT